MPVRLVAFVISVILVALPACFEPQRTKVASDSAIADVVVPIRDVTTVDMLFVIDTSCSMAEEQNVLAEQFEILARELIFATNADGPAVESLHVGVVTPDMGTGGHVIQTCSNPDVGDNGALQNEGRPSGCADFYRASDCEGGTCPWLSHSIEHPDDGSDPDNTPLWYDFGCIGTLGTCGCGFEQPLEASYVALVEQTLPGGPNEGFLRDDSLLVIIYVTDEDDCSTPDPEMFDVDRDDLGSLNVRCTVNPDRLHPIARYHDAFIELRDGDEERVVVAAIVGIPREGTWTSEELRDISEVDPTNPLQLLKSCDTAMGAAYPPVRIAELVESFGDNGILASICSSDWTDTLVNIAQTIEGGLGM
jgi:hypothetical protein